MIHYPKTLYTYILFDLIHNLLLKEPLLLNLAISLRLEVVLILGHFAVMLVQVGVLQFAVLLQGVLVAREGVGKGSTPYWIGVLEHSWIIDRLDVSAVIQLLYGHGWFGNNH